MSEQGPRLFAELPERDSEAPQVTSRHTARHEGKLYDVHTLIEFSKDLPEEVTLIEQFGDLRDHKYWHDKKGNWVGPSDIITLAEQHGRNWDAMLSAKEEWAEHTASVRDANYEGYPLLVVGKDTVIDGMHRLTKAWIDHVREVRVKRFEQLPSEAETEE